MVSPDYVPVGLCPSTHYNTCITFFCYFQAKKVINFCHKFRLERTMLMLGYLNQYPEVPLRRSLPIGLKLGNIILLETDPGTLVH